VCIVYDQTRLAKFSKWGSQISGIEENTIKDVYMTSLFNFTSAAGISSRIPRSCSNNKDHM
jgi:hypothetical protein